jgi:glycosyltransferase involved in cell wall biosynthesis
LKVTLVRSRAIDPAVNKTAKALSQNGHEVELLLWDRSGKKHTEKIDGYSIIRFGFKAPHDKPTVIFYLPIWWINEFFFLLKQDSTVIHACDLDTLIPAILVKLIKRVKLCYTIYDFYSANLPNKSPKIVRKFVAFLEISGIRFADVLILVDEDRFEQVKDAEIKKVIYIYNSPPDYFNTKNRPKLNTGSELKIFYAGIIVKSRGLEYVLEALRQIDDVKLLIVGTGEDRYLFENPPIDVRNKIQYIGQVSYEKVIQKTMESDILFAFYDPIIPNNRYASPNKLFEAMMCGKPIIVNSEIAASKIVQTEKCGLIVPYGNVDSIREAILRLKNNPDLRKELGENGRRAYEKKYSWNIMKEKLLNAYKALNQGNR